MKGSKYRVLFNGRARDYARVLRRFREEDLTTIRSVLLKASASERTELLGGSPFSRNLETLIAPRLAEPTKSLRAQVQWIAFSLTETHQRLVKHLQRNRLFLRKLLVGNYLEAREILRQIEQAFGLSLWTCQARLHLAQLAGGLSANREYLEEIRAHCNGLATILLEYMSQCAENELPYAQYLSELNNVIGALEEGSDTRDLARWMRFRLAPLSITSMEAPERMLWGEEYLAAIDRYNGLVRMLQLVASLRNSVKTALPDALYPLADATAATEPELAWVLFAHYGKEITPAPGPSHDTLLRELVEAYTIGHYDIVIDRCRETLLETPEVFELYELYVNACAHGNVQVVPLHEENTIASTLLRLVNSCIQRSDHNNALNALRKLAIQFDGSQLGHQIGAFCMAQSDHAVFFPSRAIATSATSLTPRFAFAFADRQRGTEYLSRFGESASAQIFRSVLMREPNQIVTGVPSLRALKYQGAALLFGDRPSEARDTYKQLRELATEAQVIPTAYSATLGLFRSYLALRDFASAAALVIDEYQTNSPYLDGLPLSALAEEMNKLRPTPSIVWSVFWWIYFDMNRVPVSGRRKIYEMYDDYLRSMGAKYPTELLPRIAEIPPEYLVLFLGRVCTLDTMSSSWRFRGTDLLEEQRVKICEALVVLDVDHANSYRDEVAQLLRRAATREILKQVDRTKIYVNVRGIRDSLDDSFSQRFLRFRAYSDLTETIRRNSLSEDLAKTFRNFPNLRLFLISDRSAQLLNDLFRDIRQRYISSNEYGLDSYLSVRVRHGVLSGQIRGLFEKHHLITQRPKPEAPYEKNPHWISHLTNVYEPSVADQSLKLLQELSQSVDNLIAEFRNEILQIKSATKLRGFFDYELNDHAFRGLLGESLLVKTYDEFLDLIFKTLWTRTAANLEATVTYIRNDLSSKLSSMLEILDTQLQAIGVNPWSSLIRAIRSCRTDVVNELEVIASWFSIVHPNEFPRFSAHDACSSLIVAIKRILPSYDATIDLNIQNGLELKGELLTSFFDMMLIVLVNAVRHSGLSRPRVKVDISADDHLHVRVSNPLNGTEKAAQLATVALNISPGKWQLDQNVRVEGGSGLSKLRMILSYDLGLGASYELGGAIVDHLFVVEIKIPMSKITP